MAVRRIKNHGKWVWQARVAYKGLRRAAFRDSKEAARDAEAELLGALKAEYGQAEQEATAPATLRQLLEFYSLDLTARGKKPGHNHEGGSDDAGSKTAPARAPGPPGEQDRRR